MRARPSSCAASSRRGRAGRAVVHDAVGVDREPVQREVRLQLGRERREPAAQALRRRVQRVAEQQRLLGLDRTSSGSARQQAVDVRRARLDVRRGRSRGSRRTRSSSASRRACRIERWPALGQLRRAAARRRRGAGAAEPVVKRAERYSELGLARRARARPRGRPVERRRCRLHAGSSSAASSWPPEAAASWRGGASNPPDLSKGALTRQVDRAARGAHTARARRDRR